MIIRMSEKWVVVVIKRYLAVADYLAACYCSLLTLTVTMLDTCLYL